MALPKRDVKFNLMAEKKKKKKAPTKKSNTKKPVAGKSGRAAQNTRP